MSKQRSRSAQSVNDPSAVDPVAAERAALRAERVRWRRFLMAAFTSLLFLTLLGVLWLEAFLRSETLVSATLYVVVMIGLFWAAFALGLNRKARDPALSVPMIAAATAAVLYVMVQSEGSRGSLAIVLGMILLFGVFRYGTRGLFVLAGLLLTGYAAALATIWLMRGADRVPTGDTPDFVAMCFALPWFAWIGGHINRLRDQLKERKRFYETIWENAVDTIVVSDGAGLIDYVNPAVTRLLGYLPSALLGQPIGLLQDSGQAHDLRVAIDAWRSHHGAGMIETTIRHRDGQRVAVEVSLNKVTLNGMAAHVAFVRDITERKTFEARIRHSANHDFLTGLANRNLLSDRLGVAIAQAARTLRPVWVVFLDLDRFKIINDSLTHKAGDELLQQVGERLRGATRDTDTVARQGGDEFVLVLPETGDGRLTDSIVERLLQTLARPFTLNGQELFVTCSAGVAVYPGDGTDPAELIEHADIAMYRAKDSGRNTFQFYTREMNERAVERLKLENALRAALENNQFVVHYQPQFCLHTGRVVGCEALVRWQHPVRGLLAPGHFIGVAEEMGLIVPLGEWVLRAACQQARLWNRDLRAGLNVAVNLSARQFAHPDLVGTVRRIITDSGLTPRELELELTESLLMDDIEHGSRLLADLRGLGVRLAIDDFGTGYSSLAYLKRLPVDVLKVDRSFVADVAKGAEDAAIVASIIALAHNLGLEVIAEGVETTEQLHFLRTRDCDRVQGYLLGRPMPADEFARLLVKDARPLELATA